LTLTTGKTPSPLRPTGTSTAASNRARDARFARLSARRFSSTSGATARFWSGKKTLVYTNEQNGPMPSVLAPPSDEETRSPEGLTLGASFASRHLPEVDLFLLL